MRKKPNAIKSKVIEAHILLQNPNALYRMIVACDSIDSLVLDLQEEHPTRNVTRQSVCSWKFMTVAGWEIYQKEKKPELLFNRTPNPEVSDTTGDHK